MANLIKIGTKVKYHSNEGVVIAYLNNYEEPIRFYVIRFYGFGHSGGDYIQDWVDEYKRKLAYKFNDKHTYYYVHAEDALLHVASFEDKKIEDI